MPEGQLGEFLDAVRADAGLQDRLKAAADADAVVAIAREAGFPISADALLSLAQESDESDSELSDQELVGVSGGAWDSWIPGWFKRLVGGSKFEVHQGRVVVNGVRG